MANFTIIYNHEAGVYRGKCLEIPGVISEAETRGVESQYD